MSLEEILITGFKSLFSAKNLADSPYPALYRTVNFYKVDTDIEKAKEDQKYHFSANETQDENYFGIVSLANVEGLYSVKQLLELLDPANVISLRKRVSQCMIDIQNEINGVKFNVTHSLGGGYLMKSSL
jgi:membrane-anchored protein YejM (alkaline phosphatase superfamily)